MEKGLFYKTVFKRAIVGNCRSIFGLKKNIKCEYRYHVQQF